MCFFVDDLLLFPAKELFSAFVEFYDFSVEVERNNAVLPWHCPECCSETSKGPGTSPATP